MFKKQHHEMHSTLELYDRIILYFSGWKILPWIWRGYQSTCKKYFLL